MKTSKSFDKRTGTTYVYEVLESHYDPSVKQARNTRRLIGKLDPETGEIIPTRQRKKKADSAAAASDEGQTKETDSRYKTLYEQALRTIEQQEKDNERLTRQVEDLRKALLSVNETINSALHS